MELMNPIGNSFAAPVRLTKDATVKDVKGKQMVQLNAVNNAAFGKDTPGLFIDIPLFGERSVEIFGGLRKGDVLFVVGSLVPRTYKDKTYYDLKNAQVTRLSKKVEGIGTSPTSEAPVFDDDIPF